MKLFTIHRALVHTLVGRVSDEIFRRVVALLVSALTRGRRPGASTWGIVRSGACRGFLAVIESVLRTSPTAWSFWRAASRR